MFNGGGIILFMGISIRDVAKKANVSPATVSLVLNEKPGVGAETRNNVRKAMEELEYIPGLHISRSRPEGTIRFLRIAKHGHIINRNHNVFISDYIEGMELEAKQNRFSLEVSSYNSFNFVEIVDSVNSSNITGLVILGTELDASDVERFKNVNVPVVFIDTDHAYCPFDFVDMNNESSIYSVISHFVENGHKRIGLVKASFETRNFRLREIYFKEALDYYSIPLERNNIFSIDSTFEKGYQDMKTLLGSAQNLPTALFCICDIVAYSTMRALKEFNYKIPDDISVAGFDDLPSSQLSSPPLTSVKVSKKRIGRRAIQLLKRRLSNSINLPYEKTLIGGELIIRESVKNRTGV